MKPDTIRDFLGLSDRLLTGGQPAPEHFPGLRAAGIETVINLALPSSTGALPEEGDLVTRAGMRYVHIPVDFARPRAEDFSLFATVLRAVGDRPTFVHCARNMRVSAFIYLYRVCCEGWEPERARADLDRIWKPDGVWAEFLRDVEQRAKVP